jgi:hypothetical protein
VTRGPVPESLRFAFIDGSPAVVASAGDGARASITAQLSWRHDSP